MLNTEPPLAPVPDGLYEVNISWREVHTRTKTGALLEGWLLVQSGIGGGILASLTPIRGKCIASVNRGRDTGAFALTPEGVLEAMRWATEEA